MSGVFCVSDIVVILETQKSLQLEYKATIMESTSIQAIQLAKKVFESVNGSLGLLKFNVEELQPTNGNPAEDSKKWRLVCSFYETLGSTSPSKYEANVDLNTNTVTIKKLGIDPATTDTYHVTKTPS